MIDQRADYARRDGDRISRADDRSLTRVMENEKLRGIGCVCWRECGYVTVSAMQHVIWTDFINMTDEVRYKV